MKQKHGPVFDGEPPEGPVECIGVGAGLVEGAPTANRSVLFALPDQFDGNLADAPLPTQDLAARIDGDAPEPGVETVGVAQAPQFPPRENERLLGRIFCIDLTAEDGERRSVHDIDLPAHESIERGPIAVASALDELSLQASPSLDLRLPDSMRPEVLRFAQFSRRLASLECRGLPRVRRMRCDVCNRSALGDHPQMNEQPNSIRPFYADWELFNQRLITGIRDLTPEQLALRPAPKRWPMWATVGHTAGVRVYWLCEVFGEPGKELTPFADMVDGLGWEDDEAHPRDANELVEALETTWRIVDGILDRWTPQMLAEPFECEVGGKQKILSRRALLMRFITHEAYHCGELSQTLGIHGLTQIDLWPPGSLEWHQPDS